MKIINPGEYLINMTKLSDEARYRKLIFQSVLQVNINIWL